MVQVEYTSLPPGFRSATWRVSTSFGRTISLDIA